LWNAQHLPAAYKSTEIAATADAAAEPGSVYALATAASVAAANLRVPKRCEQSSF